MPSVPRVLLIGGPDVDSRLGLMAYLKSNFEIVAAGSARELEARFLAAGFKYHAYHLRRGVHPLADLYTLYSLGRLCKALRPDIVHTFDTKPGVYGRLAARWGKVPVIIGTLPGLGSLYVYNDLFTRIVRGIYELLQKLAGRVSQLTVLYTYHDAQRLIADGVVNGTSTLIIRGSGVPTDLFSQSSVSDTARADLASELGIKPGQIVVTMISRVIRPKGVLEFMASAQYVRSRSPNVHFLLIGSEDSETRGRLNRTELSQLEQVITWPGRLQDVRGALAVSDIFVFPSTYGEGIPRVLMEAASMGLPIVTTDLPGCTEVVEDNVNGFVVPVHDTAALCQAISRLVERRELRQSFGLMSRKRAVERFELSKVAAQTGLVYQNLLRRKAGGRLQRSQTSD